MSKTEGWEKSWEKANHENSDVNFHAYRLGWLQGKKERDEMKEKIEDLQKEIRRLNNLTRYKRVLR
jgi:hypothetical protein